MPGIFGHSIRLLKKSFQSYPQLSNSVTGFITFSAGELISQYTLSDEEVDYRRAVKTGTLGILMNGLCLHQWYLILDRTFGSSLVSRQGIILKIIAGRLLILNAFHF